MIWSYSGSRTFKKCQRQWYFRTIVGHHAAKDPIRQETYRLSKLQSISAWRGSLVDEVISRRIINAVNKNGYIGLEGAINFARQLFDQQREFAEANRYREPGMKPTVAGDKYAAFLDVEYAELCDVEIEQAWGDIVVALTNLFEMDALWVVMNGGSYLVAQRPLSFKLNGMSIRAIPDLIIFNRGHQPIIVDWKVHTFGTSDYRKQLACYALALSRCKPHKDFPNGVAFKAAQMPVIEVQLLTNQIREYALTDTDLLETESYITSSIEQMKLTKGTLDNRNLRPFDFDVAVSPEICERCPFRIICWDDSLWQE